MSIWHESSKGAREFSKDTRDSPPLRFSDWLVLFELTNRRCQYTRVSGFDVTYVRFEMAYLVNASFVSLVIESCFENKVVDWSGLYPALFPLRRGVFSRV